MRLTAHAQTQKHTHIPTHILMIFSTIKQNTIETV